MPDLKKNAALAREVETASTVEQDESTDGKEKCGGTNPDELLSRRQVEAQYGITVKHLERAAWTGDGPLMVKFGYRTVRYRRRDIVQYIAAHLVREA